MIVEPETQDPRNKVDDLKLTIEDLGPRTQT